MSCLVSLMHGGLYPSYCSALHPSSQLLRSPVLQACIACSHMQRVIQSHSQTIPCALQKSIYPTLEPQEKIIPSLSPSEDFCAPRYVAKSVDVPHLLHFRLSISRPSQNLAFSLSRRRMMQSERRRKRMLCSHWQISPSVPLWRTVIRDHSCRLQNYYSSRSRYHTICISCSGNGNCGFSNWINFLLLVCSKSPRITLVKILLATQQLQWILSVIFIFNQEPCDYCSLVGSCYQWEILFPLVAVCPETSISIWWFAEFTCSSCLSTSIVFYCQAFSKKRWFYFL